MLPKQHISINNEVSMWLYINCGDYMVYILFDSWWSDAFTGNENIMLEYKIQGESIGHRLAYGSLYDDQIGNL